MVAGGAILRTPGRPPGDLVGEWRWQGDDGAFWFTAFGDAARDAHVLRFESFHSVPNLGVCFYRDGVVAATLSPIDATQLEDPDDYRVAWKLWQQVAPLRRGFIDQCSRNLAGGEWSADGL